MKKSVKSVFTLMCLTAAGIVTFGDEPVMKTWELTIPDGVAGTTNNAPVVLSDGNYELNGWIYNAAKKTLGIGRPGDNTTLNDVTGIALRKDVNGNVIGSGDLDMRGAITIDGVASDWKIVRMGWYCFTGASNKVVPCPFRNGSVYLPNTVESLGMATFQNAGPYYRFVLHSPYLTGALPNNTFLRTDGPKVVDLKIPNARIMDGYWVRTGYDSFLSETDVTDWDLSSVQMITVNESQDKYKPGYIFRWGSFRGAMRMPSLKYLNPQSFINAKNMNVLEVGHNGTLEYVGFAAVSNCAALGSVALGGSHNGFTISTNAFYSANITNVTFLTTPPDYEEQSSIIFGTESTPARSMVFYIPLQNKFGWKHNWFRYVAAARKPTAAELADFTARFGSDAAGKVIGIVPPSAFRTANEQWLAYGAANDIRFTVKASVMDSRFDGDTVLISPAPDANGCYRPGTQVTITAIPNAERGYFVRWRGKDVDESNENDNPLTLTIDRNINLVAQFAHDWIFRLDNPEEGFQGWKSGTISNQVWKLGMRVSDASQGTLSYGTNGTGGAWTDMGSGMLDLNGRVFMEDGTGGRRELSIVNFNGGAFKGPYMDGIRCIPDARYPRTIVMRENLSAIPAQYFRCQGGAVAVTNFIYENSLVSGKFGIDWFCGFIMQNGRFRLPKITELPSAYTWTLKDVDVSDWRLDSVDNVVGERTGTYGTFRGMFSGPQTFTGTLHLPALANICTNAFREASRMDGIEIGSNVVVKTIGTRAFEGCSNLKRIQLRAGRELTVGGNSFDGTSKLKTLEFTFERPDDPTAVDNMLVGTTDALTATQDPPVIYASRLMGWNSSSCTRIRRPTEAESAVRPFWVKEDNSLIGVWETADGIAKAWIVNVAAPEDPKGTMLILR